MTAVVALMAKDKGGPEIKCQIMFWPVTDANFDTPSYQEYADGYFLTKPMMKWFWDAYLPDQARRKEVYASPLQATTKHLTGLPPALIQTAGNDVLRDEGAAREKGVPPNFSRVNAGLVNGGWLYIQVGKPSRLAPGWPTAGEVRRDALLTCRKAVPGWPRGGDAGRRSKPKCFTYQVLETSFPI
jgi:acetyl esterase/lipase